MIGQTVSHYKIVRQLGAGGMGVVFAAQDPRLGREVALKFVPEELGHDLHALERLRSEARTASGLNHPNICTIYDIGDYEGRPFIVMELLRGQTLRERMTTRPLKVHETLDIAIQASDALYAAHTRDIIHRDIKPANLFLVESGQLKILDFGLAKLVPSAVSSEMTVAPTIDLTAVGVALGTVAYMSPEQVTGESLDRRTDLFSLGVVLYECGTGQQPFKGKTSAVVLASILTQTPVPPVSINPEIPIRLQEIINNCLEKDRELRYQDAASLRTDLKRLKRDLESGASGTMRTTSATLLATGAITPQSPSGSVEAGAIPAADSQPAKTTDAAALASGRTTVTSPASNRGPMIGIAAAAAVVIVAAGGFLMMRKPSGPAASPAPAPAPAVAQNRAAPEPSSRAAETAANRVVVENAAASLLAGNYRAALSLAEEALSSDAGNSEAARVRAEAAAAIARFDEAIVSANRALAAGDADAATRALNAARTVDPAAPVVATLSARILEQVTAQSDAARKAAADAAARSAAQSSANAAAARRPTPPPAEPSRPQAPPPAAAPAVQAAVPPPAPAPQTQPPPTPQPTPSAGQNAAPSTPAVQPPPQTQTPPPARADAAPPTRPAPTAPAPAVEDDDAAIRRVVASYARAIETKDIALFKSVKPNLSPLEQRRIEEGFRGIDQRVNVTILSIEHRGADAIVRAHRHDVITARGRVQTADAEQTLTLTKTGQGWIIREIGR